MPDAHAERPVSRRILADLVYEELFARLMDGRYGAGEPIGIDPIARSLAVSPTPVREALARLEATGLVARTALKGYAVAPLPTREELGQLMEARRAIEPVSARLTAGRMTSALRVELERSIRRLAEAPTGPSFAQFRPYWEADELFHRLIAENSGNPYLLTAHSTLRGHVQRFRQFRGLGVTDSELAIAEHTAILDALTDGQGASAARAMDRHLRNVQRRAMAESDAVASAQAPAHATP